MKAIEILMTEIEQRIYEAHEQIEHALMWRDVDKELSDCLYRMASEMMGQADRLQAHAVRILHMPGNEAVMPIWEYAHKKDIDKAAKVHAMMGMYKM